jgi:hypothetical protein
MIKGMSMKHAQRWKVLVLLCACLQLGACKHAQEAAQEEDEGPAKIEHLDGAEPTKVTLTEDAAKRLDIQTSPVRDVEMGGVQRRVIPYAAILYDIDGDTWTYTNPEPLVFFRHHIVVEHIMGEDAVLSDGPDTGLVVVSVGAEELYGAEVEFEEE